MLNLNLLVLRAKDSSKLVSFYEKLGMTFVIEQHGSGPEHYSAKIGEVVFEIYPLNSNAVATTSVRLGFSVSSIEQTLAELGHQIDIVLKPTPSPWGLRAAVKDPEGHTVELLEI